MSKKYIIALDQGTTSSRAIIFNKSGEVVASCQQEFKQFFPKPGWVEHNPNEILATQIKVLQDVVARSKILASEIASIGITNQRETTVIWDEEGKPIYNAIVWQDRRTSKYCDKLKEKGYTDLFKKRTGLLLDSYFSGTKIKWILDKVKGARKKAKKGELKFGTIDTWLLYNLSEGNQHATDPSNASRTLIYNIRKLKWDKKLLKILGIPKSILPEVRSSSEIFGYLKQSILGEKVPISGMIGDQQSALFGQLCTKKGMTKNTYGTGCFLVMNTGSEIVNSKNKLLSTIAWKLNNKVTYALEGSVFIGGAVIQWLRDGLGIIESTEDSETMALKVKDNGGVYFVPALVGLGAPHWDQYARGSIFGITRGTNKNHIVRAALESICFQVNDVVTAMDADRGKRLRSLRVDGGAVKNNLLLQMQADILNAKVIRPKTLETTALGAALLAGLSVGFWQSIDEIKSLLKIDKTFDNKITKRKRKALLRNWDRALDRSKSWIE